MQGVQGTTGVQGVTGLQGIQGTQGETGVQGTTGADAGSTGVISFGYNNAGTFLTPTGMLGEFEMPYRYNIYGWDVTHGVGGHTGTCFIQMSNSTYASYPPSTTNNLSGYTGAWTRLMLKNTGTSAWTGAAGDIIRIYGAGMTGMSSISLMLKYNKY